MTSYTKADRIVVTAIKYSRGDLCTDAFESHQVASLSYPVLVLSVRRQITSTTSFAPATMEMVDQLLSLLKQSEHRSFGLSYQSPYSAYRRSWLSFSRISSTGRPDP